MSDEQPDYLLDVPQLLQAGDIPGALAMVEKAIVADDEDHQAWRMKSLIHTALGQPEAAAEAMVRSEELDDGGIDTQLGRAAELAMAGDPEGASRIYSKLTEDDPELYEAWGAHAHLLLEMGKKEEAIVAATRAVEIEDGEPHLHYTLGRCYRLCGRNPEATIAFDRAVQLDAGHALAHYEKGMSLEQQGELEASLACFERVLEISPEDPNALQALAAIKQQIEKRDSEEGEESPS